MIKIKSALKKKKLFALYQQDLIQKDFLENHWQKS